MYWTETMKRAKKAYPAISNFVRSPGLSLQKSQVAEAEQHGQDTDGDIDIKNGLPAEIMGEDAIGRDYPLHFIDICLELVTDHR